MRNGLGLPYSDDCVEAMTTKSNEIMFRDA